MYLIVVGVNLIVRFERIRRQAAMAGERQAQQELSMAPRYWATGAARSCTTDVMTDGSKLVGVAALQEQEETALAVRLFFVGFF